MRTSTAYFVGAGTVIAAIAAGLGGGLLVADIVSPHSPKNGTEMTRLEQRMSTQPIPVIAAPSEPVPYLAATQAAATNPVSVAPADQARPEQGQQTQAANTVSPPQPPTEATAASPSAASVSAQSSAPAAQPVAHEQAASPQDAVARARDADTRRAVVEKRRYDRRQQWAEKRRYQQRQDRELREVEQRVREETEPTQAVAAEPAKLEMPRVRLFESE
jgi:hypothetical protein